MRPIGIVRTPYTLRHDCPRQPMMRPAPGAEPQDALATIELYEGLGLEASVRDLRGLDFNGVSRTADVELTDLRSHATRRVRSHCTFGILFPLVAWNDPA